jgi:hypothetical protein
VQHPIHFPISQAHLASSSEALDGSFALFTARINHQRYNVIAIHCMKFGLEGVV